MMLYKQNSCDEAKLQQLKEQGERLEHVLQGTECSEQEKQQYLFEYLNKLNVERAAEVGVWFSERMFKRISDALSVQATDDTAVDLLYSCILLQQFHGMLFDSWRAHPAIESCREVLHMLEQDQKWSDCLRYCQTTVDTYMDIAWWPEVLEYSKMAYGYAKKLLAAGVKVLENSELVDLADCAYPICFSALHTKDGITAEIEDLLKTDLGAEGYASVLAEAQEKLEETIADPVEQTPEYLAIRYELEEKIDEALDHERGYYNYYKDYWMAKRIILRSEYGIRWKSPAALNPDLDDHS